MEKEQRTRLQKATQDARKLLEEEFRSQLLQTYDIDVEKVRWAEEPGAHLLAEQRLIREKLIAWIEHKEAQINDRKEALLLALREMAFTALNRFVALKLMEARELVRPCVSGGLESAGFLEFSAVAQGLLADQESSYRLYLETIFEDVSRELRALFDPRDAASLLWPKRAALLELLDILNRSELAELWSEDETLGWVYQYFNGDAERKRMREESSAPRNSRELAVRNQFFTPRYVVEFLADNTLGRVWYEMLQGDTGLKDRCRYLVRRPNEFWLQPGEEAPAQPDTNEALSQEELLRQPVHISHRELKDPREIRMLDPACGSMHFGLYAFDLYLEIYSEAWEIAQDSEKQNQPGKSFASFKAYAARFSDKSSFMEEVPRLILEHNIHGIDIDPRATQIAKLTLWLRTQRAWLDQGIELARRPTIKRSNVVCAEPMPGEKHLLADFVDQQFPDAERGLIQQLLEDVFDNMRLAGETGTLLKIEQQIRTSIEKARKKWLELSEVQGSLFGQLGSGNPGQAVGQLEEDVQNLTRHFWSDIEEKIYIALSDFSSQAENTSYFRRRLFVEDASQGFAFVDACRKRYDAVVMNPPFGLPTALCEAYAKEAYPDTWQDIYSSFYDRAIEVCKDSIGYVGAITPKSFYHAKGFRGLRSLFKSSARIESSIDVGGGVLDAAVEVCFSIVESTPPKAETLALFSNLVSCEKESLPGTVNNFVRHVNGGSCSDLIVPVLVGKDCGLPNEMLPYRFPSELLSLLKALPSFEASSGSSVVGITTFDNDRFIRLAWESADQDRYLRKWLPVAMGGGWNPFYAEFNLIVKWEKDAAEMRANELRRYNTTARTMQSQRFWHRPGLTFSKIGKAFSAQPFPEGSIFTSVGFCIFSNKIDNWSMLGYFNSKPVCCLLSLFSADRHWHSNSIASIPMPLEISPRVGELARRAYSISARLQGRCSETSPDFICCAKSVDIGASILDFQKVTDSLANEVSSLLGLSKATLDFLSLNGIFESREFFITLADLARQRLSYCLGVVFGRWDIRHATGELTIPELPDPFENQPICPPGQLVNTRGLPVFGPEEVPPLYPVSVAWNGVLVDDPGHPLDLSLRVRESLNAINSAQVNAQAQLTEVEICQALEVSSFEDLFRRPANFFAEHLKLYSKSRRQAPIYWQLTAGNGGYSALLYYHRLTHDTLYLVVRDFLEPRIQQAEREQFELESQGALSGDAAAGLQESQTLLQDLRILKGELELVAPLWNPNLNDGVIINHAILWRITPYTPWQKKCKECWGKLVKGEYDWAHLAFHLWPERVIPKCTTDRSLAIAHGLEERLWQETNNGNWVSRQLSDAELQALISDHTKPAVKNALERFLAAPPPVAPTRTRASRSTRASGSSAPRRPRGTPAVVDAEATRQVLLALTAAPSDGLAKAAIADLVGVEANALTAVIKQLKDSGQIDQLGERRGARYVLSEQGRARLEQEEAG